MELQAQAGGGGCQEDDRIDGGAAGGQIGLQAQAGGGKGAGRGQNLWCCCWRTGGAGVAGGQVELLAQAGVGGRQGEDRIHGSAARGRLELQAGCGRGREGT